MSTLSGVVLDLGPCPVEDAVEWSTFARRVMGHLRNDNADNAGSGWPDGGAGAEGVDDDTTRALFDGWTGLTGQWLDRADECERGDRPFRWSAEMEPERAEFLLDGLDRSLHSDRVRSFCSRDELDRQRPFTVLVVRSFLDGLMSESDCCRQYADQVSTSLRALLPD